VRLLKIAFLSALTIAAVWAQATAQIHGVVSDMSGAAIPGGRVSARGNVCVLRRTRILNSGDLL
jgi:hypothetical protein